MRVKALPPPPADLDAVDEARAAVPRVPKSELDCCDRLVARAGVAGRDVAREWLTLLRGLGLVEETPHGYARTAAPDPDREALAAAFVDGVFGAREALDALDDGTPATADDVFDAVAADVPTWERARDPDGWLPRWQDRVRRVLDWLVLLDLADRTDTGYTRE